MSSAIGWCRRCERCSLLISRLALGTVQFGLPYGVANQRGQVSHADAAVILEHAWAAGIDTLDTAIAYGESERRLGEIGVGSWKVVSKLPPVPASCSDVAGWARRSVMRSLETLRLDRLRGLLLHRSQDLVGEQGVALHAALEQLKIDGLVERIGVSIYGPNELDALWPRFQLDLVQAPLNVFDRRLADTGWLSRLHAAQVEVHTRSTFLQGLLLMEHGSRPTSFDRWQLLFDEWHRWLLETGLTPLRASLGFVQSHAEVDRVVVGVDSVKQLCDIVAAAGSSVVHPPKLLASDDENLISPSRWISS